MADFLSLFANHSQYVQSADTLPSPNVACCHTEGEVHYKPLVSIRATFVTTAQAQTINITRENALSGFTEIYIDNVRLQTLTPTYTFSTSGTHTIEYTLKNPYEIQDNAFSYCRQMTSVEIPNPIEIVGKYAFISCESLTSVTIPNSVKKLKEGVFYACYALKNIEFGRNVEEVSDRCMYFCSGLTSVVFGESISGIGLTAFMNCTSLHTLAIPNSIESIGPSAFKDCSGLTSVTIGNNVKSINYEAFNGCSAISSIVIPDSVTSIGDKIFYRCQNLTNVVVGSGVTSIGDNAFTNSGLGNILMKPTTPPEIGRDILPISSGLVIYVKNQTALTNYESAEGWSNYANYMRIEPT